MTRKSRNITKGPQSDAHDNASTTAGEKPKRLQLTHFLCIPLVTETSRPQLEKSLQEFQSKMHEHVPLLSAKAIRPVGTLHLTLGVMSLVDEERLEGAIALLKSLGLKDMLKSSPPPGLEPTVKLGLEGVDNTITIPATLSRPISPPLLENQGAASTGLKSNTDPKPPIINLTSLHSMHSPHSTSVLYAHPQDPTFRLLPFCTNLQALFTSEGYIIDDNRPLKLHATIVNTTYAKAGGRGGAPMRIDATSLIEKFRDVVWAEGVRVERVAICKMGAKKILGEGGVVVGEEYEEVAVVEMP
ncbi:hypothetical protein EJ08DRAFT_646851 [Tothia fuscella]|uniref:A-kinase anchor protein 7-like phosphoesterase domain-containing protein n=1 Tax=Tothia fuscella TaxID=1048955 RepID=A0A9P4NYF1_9PEZI|nr:hypothetical protein EJ08DRAFT_646851 [Tothia fuscella]